jgi:hypothetical protein
MNADRLTEELHEVGAGIREDAEPGRGRDGTQLPHLVGPCP